MRTFHLQSYVATILALTSTAAAAVERDEILLHIGAFGLYVFVAIAIFAGIFIYFTKLKGKQATPLASILEPKEAIHSVEPSALVTDCVKRMVSEKVGALLVMQAGQLEGIFTERDALTKVLAAGLDPRQTKVSEVMTKDPVCVSTTMTVSTAMQVVTTRRIRHLPVVRDGRVIAVISSGDLTHWLVKDKIGEVRDLVNLAAKYR